MIFNPKLWALFLLVIGLCDAGALRFSEKSLLKGDIKCSKTCTDSKNFNYQIGRSYRYSFETKNSFQPETGNALNEVKINGHAKVTIQSNCEHILKLENVNIEGTDDKAKLISELEANNLAYSFQDGEINNVCPLADEKTWTLNIKKAILSALQFAPKQVLTELSTSNVEEKDINGKCDTTYEMQSSNADQYKIIKSKNLKSCTNRMSVDSAIIGNSLIVSDLVSSYVNLLVETDYRCKLIINKKTGIVESVKCTQSSDGAKYIQKDLRTHHEITLKFSNEDPVHYPQLTGSYYEDNLYGERVEFDEENTVKSVNAEELKNAIADVCQTISTSTLNHQTATKFHELTNKIKHSKDNVLRGELNRLLEDRNRAKAGKHHDKAMSSSICCPHKLFKLYLDGLISAKSSESLKILVNEIVPQNFYLPEGSVRAELKLITFYTSLAFYHKPTEETLKAALPLLELKGRHARNALFGVTALAKSILINEKKSDVPAVNSLANSIANRIPNNCDVKPTNEHQVIELLKALENIPKLPESALKRMVTCLTAKNVSPNVKVNVIKNFDYKSDNELVKKTIRDVLMNANELDEVRIQAYIRYRKQVTKENVKELEKLINSANGELASYIANEIQNLRDDQTITCPMMLAYREVTKDIDLKLSSQKGKSKTIISRPLRPFFKSNLVIKTDVIHSSKNDKPISVTSRFLLKNREILQVGFRSESGTNLLLNVANIDTLVDGLMQLVKSINAKQEDGKARLIDEWAARVFPELAKAFKDVDLYVKVSGTNLIYLNKNDQAVAFGDRLDKLKLGLAPIIAIDLSSVLQIHSISGLPTLLTKDRTILSSFVLFDSERINDNEVKFEIAPNVQLSTLSRLSYPIGRQPNKFVLENEKHLTTSFGLTGRKTKKGTKTEIRLKLSGKKVELMSHRVFNRIRDGVSVKNIPSTKKSRDMCLEHMLPIRKMLGVSICSRQNDEEKSLVLEKTEDSNVLITLEEERTSNKLTIEQENSQQKRKLSVEMKRDQAAGSNTVNVDIENPIGKGWAKIIASKDKLNIQAKLNDQKVYSLDADKSFETKGKESNFKAKVGVSFPGINQPFVVAFTTKMVDDKNLHLSGDLTVNEKTRLLTYEYNSEGKYSRIVKRSSQEYIRKADLDIKVYNWKGKNLFHSKYEGEYEGLGAKVKNEINYATSRSGEKMEKLTYESKLEIENGPIKKVSMVNKFQSSQYPMLNFKADQKFVYKFDSQKLQHYENDINIELDALGKGDERKIRLGHVSTFNNFYKDSKKSSMDHLIRIVINKVNYNREISYNGNYELIKDNIYQINDKLKVQDISASSEVLSATASLKSEDASASKLKLLIDYNCNKHGRFNWAEDINYDLKTKALSTKIVLTVSRADQQTPTVYNGEYTADEFWRPKSFDLKLRKASDNTEVLHVKRDFSKPNEKMSFVDYYGKRVYDFEMKTSKDKKFEAVKVIVASLGELRVDKSNTAEGEKLTYKLKLDSPSGAYVQKAALVYGKKVLNFEFNVARGDNKLSQLELFLSNPKKTLVTYRDVESGSILVKAFNRQLSFKHENQPTGFSSMLELQRLETKHKLTMMTIKDASKFALMTKLEKDGVMKYALDSTYSKNSPSIVTFKSEVVTLTINLNPFGVNDEDWKVLTLDFTRKDGKYKHTTKINVKKLPDNKRALAVKSASSGKRSNGKHFEHSIDSQVSSDWRNVKLNAKIGDDNKVDELDFMHEFVADKNMGFKLDHHVKLTLRNELVFEHEMKSKLEQENRLWRMSSDSEFKSKYQLINGAKVNLKSNCNMKEKTGKVDLNLEYPYRNQIIVLTYNGANALKEKFMRELKIEVSNTKLNEKDLYLAKIDLIRGLEIHFKYNKQSNAGHNLENLELHALSKPEEHSFLVVAPRGWQGHIKFLPPNKDSMAFSTNLIKRGRILFSIDSKAQIKKRDGNRKRRSINWSDELTVHNVFGFNGQAKFAEESMDLSKEELKYKFTSVFINIDANLKGLNKEKKTLYVKACSAKEVTNCALLDAAIERSAKGAKANGNFKYGLGEEAISITFDYDRQKLDNGDNQGKIKGDMNGEKFTGELLMKRNNDLDVKINLPKRVIQMKRETIPNGVKMTLLPNAVNDKAHVHSISITSSKSLAKKVIKIENIHPSFKRPIKIDLEVVYGKSVTVALDIAGDEKKALHFHAYRYLENQTNKNGFHFYREDRLIDFGRSEEIMVIVDKKSSKVQVKQSMHWVDKAGKNLTYTRDEDIEVKNESDDQYSVTSKTLMKTLEFLIDVDGRMQLNLKKRLASGVYNWLTNKEKGTTEFDYKNKCLKIESFVLPKDSYKNNHLVSLCAEGRQAEKDMIKFEYIKPQLSNKKKLTNQEQLLFKLSKTDEQNLLRLTMHWNPEMIGEFLVDTGEYLEQMEKERNAELVKIQNELEHKIDLLRDSLKNDLIQPMMKHRQDELNLIISEINPKLAAKLRNKRAVSAKAKNSTQNENFLNFTENLAKKLFNFKVVKFEPEEGQIEVLFKAHPSFEGFKYGLKSSFQYLFKA